jgi:hypothetical protein
MRSALPWLCIMALLIPGLEPGRVDARPCEHLPIQCTYQGVPFALTVIDSVTRQPVPDVHALAEWQMVGSHGGNGPLMVQDALSGTDGVLRFPKWGPVAGPVSGLAVGADPVVTLFKPGYEPVVENNRLLPETDTDELRRFGQDGATILLVPFQGSAASWLQHLRRVAKPQAIPSAPAVLRRFRTPYLNRFSRVWAEVEGLPESLRSDAKREFLVEYYLRVLEGAER